MHYYFRPLSRPTARCLTLAASLAAVPALALEETVVTANYRNSDLHDTGASVTVLTEETVQARAAQHLQDILHAAPNVSWSAASSRSRFIQIRGVGDLEQYYDPKHYPSVGLMLDRLELGDSANSALLFDLAQVEVLRGPQGTRFGSSAHAGMIYLRSNEPGDSFEGELSGGIGNYNSYRLGMTLSGPLNDALGGRLALQQFRSDGYIENSVSGADDTNDFDEFAVRGKLNWEPTAQSRYQFTAFYVDADNGHDAWSIDNSRTTYTDQPGKDAQETLGLNVTASWDLGRTHTLETTLSYTDSDTLQGYDADWVSDTLCATVACSGGNDTSQELFERSRERIIADVRLLGGADLANAGDTRYVLGLYLNDGNEDYDYRYLSVWSGNFSSRSDYETQRYALYGEFEMALSERLTLTAGARLERFKDDYRDSNAFDSDRSDDLWNAELSLKYDLDDATLIYATVARGAKPGGVNTSASANQPFMSPVFQDYIGDNLTFTDETLINKEIGVHSRLLDNRLQINAALFHTDRQNAQLENWMWDNDSALWIGYLDSNSDATTYGVELETRFTLNSTVELFANLGWLETEVDNIETFDLDHYDFVYKKNREQAKSPQYQYNVGARLTLTEQLAAQIEFEGQDDVFFGYYHDGELEAYDLINASLTWRSERATVTLWGRNLNDEDYAVHGLYFGVDPRDDAGAWGNQTYTQLGEPRTYGIDVRYSF